MVATFAQFGTCTLFGFAGAHFATFPPKLIEPCIKAATRPGDFVLDPFFGSGTVGLVSEELERRYVGIELNPEYVTLAADRLGIHESTIFKVAQSDVQHSRS